MHSFSKIQEKFKHLSEKDALSHAYLFFGSGIGNRKGRRELAQGIAQMLEYPDGAASGKPLSEYLEIVPDEKKTIGIDAVRNISHFLYSRPVASPRRTVFIDTAEALTDEAQNAILKIVEEPPAWGLILMSVENPESIFATLRSRLQKIYIPSVLTREKSPAPEAKGRSLSELLSQKVIDDDAVDEYFTALLKELDKDPIKNVEYIKSALRRLSVIKAFNTNVRLQLRVLEWR